MSEGFNSFDSSGTAERSINFSRPMSNSLERLGGHDASWGLSKPFHLDQAASLRGLQQRPSDGNAEGLFGTPGGLADRLTALGKRSFFQSSLPGTESFDLGSKSRRTTPSPGLPGLLYSPPSERNLRDDIPVIDLTGDDDAQLAAISHQQRAAEARIRENKVRSDRDAALARSMASGAFHPASYSHPPAQTSSFSQSDTHPVRTTPMQSSDSYHRYPMAGAFPTSDWGPNPGFPAPSRLSSLGLDRNRHGFLAPDGKNSGYGSSLLPLNSNGYQPVPGPLGSNYSLPGFATNGMPTFSGFDAPSPVTHSTGYMPDLLQKTSHLLTNASDAVRNALNPRLAKVLHDPCDVEPRSMEDEIQKLLSNIQPDIEIPENERVVTPEALRYRLYPHQQTALKWMTDMEMGSNKGGVLADDMGLGKTISTLALMSSRKATNMDRVKTNLIIGPVALVRQWELEIRNKLKTEHSLSVLLLHGKKIDYDELKKYDVVLTTYNSLAAEFRKYAKHVEQFEGRDDYDERNDRGLARRCPLLFPGHCFFRIILDEAQCIKNPKTQSSQAANKLLATYRWCLTGTPMMNNTGDLFPLIRFLKIGPYNDITAFRQEFGCLNPSKGASSGYQRSAAMQKLRAVLKSLMLRRLKTSKINGQPILTLPSKTEINEQVSFSADERSWYRTTEDNSRVQFNKYLRAGTVGKNYSSILVLLLRLRQACCHPHLDMDFEYVGTNEPLSEVLMEEMARNLAPAVVERLKTVDAFECPICYDAVIDPTLAIPCGHDMCAGCFVTLIENSVQNGIRDGQENEGANCPQCRGPINSKKIINYTTFKKVHMPETLPDNGAEGAHVKEEDEDEDSEDDDDDEIDVDSETDKTNPGSKSKKKNRKKTEIQPHMLKALRKEASKNREARTKYTSYLKRHWEDSAKITKAMELLTDIQAKGEKTIVFSQWTSLLDLIEIPLKNKLGIGYCRYDGGMSPTQRNNAVQSFVDDSHIRVMLCSLRAGNAGLNLTVASRVIIMDPFWNPYIEMQAVDRAHRIGQVRPVQVHRILVEDTIEDRIMQLQQSKRDLVDAALDEGEARNLGRLGQRELAFLFGVGPRN